MHVQSLTVRVLDEFGDPVEFNNGFWSMSLSIQWAMDVGTYPSGRAADAII